jgi:hypothetical protein
MSYSELAREIVRVQQLLARDKNYHTQKQNKIYLARLQYEFQTYTKYRKEYEEKKEKEKK